MITLILISILPNKIASFILLFKKALYFETMTNSSVPEIEINER